MFFFDSIQFRVTRKVTLQEKVILQERWHYKKRWRYKKRWPSILLQEKITILSHKSDELIEILANFKKRFKKGSNWLKRSFSRILLTLHMKAHFSLHTVLHVTNIISSFLIPIILKFYLNQIKSLEFPFRLCAYDLLIKIIKMT